MSFTHVNDVDRLLANAVADAITATASYNVATAAYIDYKTAFSVSARSMRAANRSLHTSDADAATANYNAAAAVAAYNAAAVAAHNAAAVAARAQCDYYNDVANKATNASAISSIEAADSFNIVTTVIEASFAFAKATAAHHSAYHTATTAVRDAKYAARVSRSAAEAGIVQQHVPPQ
jgi:hypothetical protein